MKRFAGTGALALTGALLLAAAALGARAEAQRSDAQKVTVGATEFKFALVPKTVKKGAVAFAVTNKGSTKHDFKIAGKKTALLSPGKKATLTVTFSKPGRYAYLCTVPGHAAAGMKGVLTVK